MFFASARPIDSDHRQTHRAFARDLAASLVALGALGALLVTIQAKSAPPDTRGLKVVPGLQNAQTHRQLSAGRPAQPSDRPSTPDADEERIANAVMAFALSKVSPLRPELVAETPPDRTGAIPSQQAMAPAPPRKPAKLQAAQRFAPVRIPAGMGQTGFSQAEWPAKFSAGQTSATPKDQSALVAMARLVPAPQAIPGALVTGAGTIAENARKTVSYGVSGLRSGVTAVQEKALATAGKLW